MKMILNVAQKQVLNVNNSQNLTKNLINQDQHKLKDLLRNMM